MKIHKFLTKDRWHKGCLSVDAEGRSVEATDTSAVRWCVIGAAVVCYPTLSERDTIIHAIREEIRRRGIVRFIDCWNDDPETTFEQLQEVLRVADV